MKTGKIPNVNKSGISKNIFYTDGYFNSAQGAKNALGLKQSPTYRVTFNRNSVRANYGSLRNSGSAEYTTDKVIDALSVDKLK